MNTLIGIVVILSGLLGIVGRWLNLWKQKRTTGTFWQYLLEDYISTLQSFVTNLASSAAMISALPVNTTFGLAVSTAWGAFGIGYGIDSKLNKDLNPSIPHNNEAISLQDIINRNSK